MISVTDYVLLVAPGKAVHWHLKLVFQLFWLQQRKVIIQKRRNDFIDKTSFQILDVNSDLKNINSNTKKDMD
jgi:hypothetical protein